jgi:hypothetical protein
MKTTHYLFIFSLVALTACSTTRSAHHDSAKADPETVLITYHVKPGKETELQAALSRAWQIYRNEHLVVAEPHIVLRDTEDGDKTRIIEVFTWISHAAPDRAPDSVKTIWQHAHHVEHTTGRRHSRPQLDTLFHRDRHCCHSRCDNRARRKE